MNIRESQAGLSHSSQSKPRKVTDLLLPKISVSEEGVTVDEVKRPLLRKAASVSREKEVGKYDERKSCSKAYRYRNKEKAKSCSRDSYTEGVDALCDSKNRSVISNHVRKHDFNWQEADVNFVVNLNSEREKSSNSLDDKLSIDKVHKYEFQGANAVHKYNKSVDSAASNYSKCNIFERDPWGISPIEDKCDDAKFTSVESDDDFKCEVADIPSPKYVVEQSKENLSVCGAMLNKSTCLPLKPKEYKQLATDTSVSKSSYDSRDSDGPQVRKAKRRLIRWQAVTRDDSESTPSLSPGNTSSESEIDSNSYTPIGTPNHTPVDSGDDTPNCTAYHTPKHTFSSDSDSDRSNTYKYNKRNKICRITRGDYTKLDTTGSSDLIGGTTECNATNTVVTGTTGSTTVVTQQNDELVNVAKTQEGGSHLDDPVKSESAAAESQSLLSNSSSTCDAYQRISPGGTPWTIWYRAPSLDCGDVPPLIQTLADDTLERMRRRMTEIPR